MTGGSISWSCLLSSLTSEITSTECRESVRVRNITNHARERLRIISQRGGYLGQNKASNSNIYLLGLTVFVLIRKISLTRIPANMRTVRNTINKFSFKRHIC